MKFEKVNKLIQMALEEDIGQGDITTNILIPPDQKGEAFIIAKQNGIIAGLPLINLVYRKLDKKIRVTLKVKEGDKVKKGQKIAIVRGLIRAILTGERTVLNFLQRLSGIATLTHRFVQKVKKYSVKILDTRKTIPGWRVLDKYAVRVGGGVNHRLDLNDAVLVKENHLKALSKKGSPQNEIITNAIKKIDILLRSKKIKKVVEIEVRNLKEFRIALKERPDIIMLDNMGVSQIKQAVYLRNQLQIGKPLLEVSGGVTLKNITKFARTGVDFISIGALTHSAPALDIAMKIR